MSNTLPFLHNTCLSSDDFEEAQQFLNSLIDEREIKPLTARHHDRNLITMQPLQQTLLFGAHWGEQVHVLSEALSTCHLVLPQSRSIQVRNLNRTIGPNELLLMMPGSEADLVWEAGCSAIVITFDIEALQLCAGLGQSFLQSRALQILRPEQRQTRSLLSLLQCVATQHQIYEGDIQPLMQQHWESLLVQDLTNLLQDPTPENISILPAHLRRAIDWLQANIEQSISVSDLVQVAQCSRRSLENGFQQFVGCSPARYIQKQKLELVHQRLLQAQGTVSEIAFDCGFNHLSHFTRMYKEHYGEAPSQTLKQRKLVAQG